MNKDNNDIEELDLSWAENKVSTEDTILSFLEIVGGFMSFIVISFIIFTLWCILMDALFNIWDIKFSFIDYFRGVFNE